MSGFIIDGHGGAPQKSDTYCTYDKSIQKIHENILRLNTTTAYTQIHAMEQSSPGNLARIHMENYLDCLKLFISQDEDMYNALKPLKKERLEMVDELSDDDGYAAYLYAEITLQWAAVRFKFGEYFTAFTEVRKAYKYLERAIEINSGNQPAQMRLAILEALIGTIPEPYLWGAQLIGLQGSISGGMNRLQKCIDEGRKTNAWYLPEAIAVQIYLNHSINNKTKDAVRGLQDPVFKEIKGPLYIFLATSIYRKAGKNNLALDVLDQYLPRSCEFPLPFIHYMKGEALLRKLDKGAETEFNHYLRLQIGKDYTKASYQKLAWNALVHDNKANYTMYMDLALRRGVHKLEEDKSSLKEAKKKNPPDTELLKSRLLFDGGYYERSLQILNKINVSTLQAVDKLEYLYRRGRSKEMLNDNREAIALYDQVIEKGATDPSYYACNSALLTGQIYENWGQKGKAKAYYELCLDINPDEYKSGIHQRAKAGLLRLNAQGTNMK